MKSISKRLLVLLLSAIILAAALAVTASYLKVNDEISELFDYQILQMALSFRNTNIYPQRPKSTTEYEKDEGFVICVWDESGKILYSSHPKKTVVRPKRDGLQTIASEGIDWRIFLLTDYDKKIQVSQSMDRRRATSFELALQTIYPLMAIFLLLAIIIWVAVHFTLKPLMAVSDEVSRLSPNSLERLSENDLPKEILPLVKRLNILFDQLEHAFDIQKRFVADAAHELRTPLTAVKLQLRILERSSSEEERSEAFVILNSGIDRASRLVSQLLALARVAPEASNLSMEKVSLNKLIAGIVAEQSGLAFAKGINLGIGDKESVSILGEQNALISMISNLVDNAIRYTPPGGKIDVNIRHTQSSAIIEVADSGPGIPEKERERVFDRFFRGNHPDGIGCGLGLAIVKSAVTRHHGCITFAKTSESKGLKVVIELPLTPA